MIINRIIARVVRRIIGSSSSLVTGNHVNGFWDNPEFSERIVLVVNGGRQGFWDTPDLSERVVVVLDGGIEVVLSDYLSLERADYYA